MNRRLSIERNTMAKILKTALEEPKVTKSIAPRVSQCLKYMGQVSDEFRLEMEGIIEQFNEDQPGTSTKK